MHGFYIPGYGPYNCNHFGVKPQLKNPEVEVPGVGTCNHYSPYPSPSPLDQPAPASQSEFLIFHQDHPKLWLMWGLQWNDTIVLALSKNLMKSGKLAQVHTRGIKAGSCDQCFREMEQSSKEIRPWTSIDITLKDTDDPSCRCIIADTTKCRRKW